MSRLPLPSSCVNDMGSRVGPLPPYCQEGQVVRCDVLLMIFGNRWSAVTMLWFIATIRMISNDDVCVFSGHGGTDCYKTVPSGAEREEQGAMVSGDLDNEEVSSTDRSQSRKKKKQVSSGPVPPFLSPSWHMAPPHCTFPRLPEAQWPVCLLLDGLHEDRKHEEETGMK